MFKLIITTISVLFGLTAVANAAPVAGVVAAIAAPTITGALTRIGLSLAISFITNKLFAPDVPQPNSDFQQSPDPGTKQRIATDTNNKLPVVYGEAKVFGSVTHAAISDDNQKMAFIIPLCEGPVRLIGKSGASGTRRGIFWDTYELRISNSTNEVTGAWDHFGENWGDEDHADYNDFLNGNLKIITKLGTATGNQSTEMETFDPSQWGDSNKDNRTLPNVAYMYVELTYDREKNVTGLSSKLGAIVEGRTVNKINRRDDQYFFEPLTVAEIVAGLDNHNNPADCLVDYLTNTTYGCGNSIKLEDLDLETFYNHREYCRVDVNFTDANGDADTAPRFSLNGVVNTHDTRDLIISDICTNSQAAFSYQLGKFQMNSDRKLTDAQLAATAQFSEDNIFGEITTLNDGFNSVLNKVTGSFVSKRGLYQDDQIYTEDLPATLLNKNEPEFIKDTRFKLIDNNVQAERIAYTILRKSRDSLIVSFETDARALTLQVNDVIRVTNDVYGYTNKPFRVNSITETDIGQGLLGYKVTAQEYNGDAYRDDTANPFTEFFDAPNVSTPNPSALGQVTGFTAVKNTANDEVTLSWTAPTTGLTDAYQIFFLANATPITNFTETVLANRTLLAIIPGSETTYKTSDLPASQNIYFWIRPTNTFGFVGPFQAGETPPSVTDFTASVSITTLGIAYIYQRSASEPTTFPSVETTDFNFSTRSFQFSGTPATDTSNGWSVNVPTGTNTLWRRDATVTNIDDTVTATEWGPALEQGTAGAPGVSTAILRVYASATSEPAAEPARYTFSTNTLTFYTDDTYTTVDSSPTWSLTFPAESLGRTVYAREATVSTTTASTAIDITWGPSAIVSNPFYEVYAYAKLATGNPPTPTTTPVLSDGVLPTSFVSGTVTWYSDLGNSELDVTTDRIFRSVRSVTGGVLTGTWSTPALFLLQGAAGAAGPTNLVRYANFETDALAIANRPTTANGFDSTGTWVSNPDLLGVDANNMPIQYTHTSSQFGLIKEPGRPYSRTFTVTGTRPTSGLGTPYNRTIAYSGTPTTTQFQGQQLQIGSFNINTNVNDKDATNTNGSGAQFETVATGGDRGFLLNFSAFNWTSTSVSTSRRLAIRFNNNSSLIFTSAFINIQDLTFQDVINHMAGEADGSAPALTRSSGGTIRMRHRALGNLTNVVIEASSALLPSITSIELGVTTASGTGFFSRTANVPVTSGAQNAIQFQFNTDRYSGISFIITRNGATIVSNTIAWTTGDWEDYLNLVRTTLISASSFIDSATTILTNTMTDLSIGFTDGASYTLNATVSNVGNYAQPVVTSTNTSITGNLPAQSSFFFTPVLTTGLDFSDVVGAKFRYCDAWANGVIEGTYPSTVTDRTTLLGFVATELGKQSHIDASINSTVSPSRVELRYTATAEYTSPQTGPTSGFDGRAPNAFIELGFVNIPTDQPEFFGDFIVNTQAFTSTVGIGAGALVNDRVTCRFQSNDTTFFDDLLLFVDDNYNSIQQQLANIVQVLYPGLFTTNITGDTLSLTTTFNTVQPHSAWNNTELTITGNNDFDNDFTNGSLGNTIHALIARVRSTDAAEVYDTRTFENRVIEITQDVNAEAVIRSITDEAARTGIYANRVGTTDSFTIEDVGTSKDRIVVSIFARNNLGNITTIVGSYGLTQGAESAGEVPDLETDTSADNAFTATRWTRPVNTGRQV